MATLNETPAAVALRHGVGAATDVTGFGLVGHALGLARESRITIVIEAAALPLLPRAVDLALEFQAGGLKANRRQFEPLLTYAKEPEEALKALLFDPQTSGGLLLLVPEESTAAVLAELPKARVIGRARPAGEKPIVIA
jgi:selenide,water dikinase